MTVPEEPHGQASGDVEEHQEPPGYTGGRAGALRTTEVGGEEGPPGAVTRRVPQGSHQPLLVRGDQREEGAWPGGGCE